MDSKYLILFLGCYNEAFQKEFTELIPALKYICGGCQSNSSGNNEENIPLQKRSNKSPPPTHSTLNLCSDKQFSWTVT